MYQVRNKNYSSWAEEFNYDDFSDEAAEYNIPMGLIQEAREVLNRSSNRQLKKGKIIKHRKECWQ